MTEPSNSPLDVHKGSVAVDNGRTTGIRLRRRAGLPPRRMWPHSIVGSIPSCRDRWNTWYADRPGSLFRGPQTDRALAGISGRVNANPRNESAVSPRRRRGGRRPLARFGALHRGNLKFGRLGPEGTNPDLLRSIGIPAPRTSSSRAGSGARHVAGSRPWRQWRSDQRHWPNLLTYLRRLT
jgi:hypothetical protein